MGVGLVGELRRDSTGGLVGSGGENGGDSKWGSVWIRMGIVVDLEWGMGEDSEVG